MAVSRSVVLWATGSLMMLLLLGSRNVNSFVLPPRHRFQHAATTASAGPRSPTLRAAAVPNVISNIPNPFKKLPWNVQKEKERQARRMKTERAKLHRELGIAEDATYEDIVAATDHLISMAGNDLKAKIKIEVAKDKILQIRLNERLAGLAAVDKAARAQSTYEVQG